MIAQTEAGGMVANYSTAGSVKLAEAHCQKFGKHARVSGTDILAGTLTFDCVP